MRIYQLRITLEGVKPPIWRRLHVAGEIALRQLHLTLQVAMGWQDKHSYEFIFSGVRYAEPGFGAVETVSVVGVLVADLELQAGERFVYRYDFGDDWLHRVEVEDVLAADPGALVPLCLGGARACPPEDCGGVDGYGDLLEKVRDVTHEEHLDAVAWAGADFDPERFELQRVNGMLASLRQRRR